MQLRHPLASLEHGPTLRYVIVVHQAVAIAIQPRKALLADRVCATY
jgi:hypothetical protein